MAWLRNIDGEQASVNPSLVYLLLQALHVAVEEGGVCGKGIGPEDHDGVDSPAAVIQISASHGHSPIRRISIPGIILALSYCLTFLLGTIWGDGVPCQSYT